MEGSEYNPQSGKWSRDKDILKAIDIHKKRQSERKRRWLKKGERAARKFARKKSCKKKKDLIKGEGEGNKQKRERHTHLQRYILSTTLSAFYKRLSLKR